MKTEKQIKEMAERCYSSLELRMAFENGANFATSEVKKTTFESTREEKIVRFKEVATPLIEFLATSVHPHHVAHVTSENAALFEGEFTVIDKSFIVD